MKNSTPLQKAIDIAGSQVNLGRLIGVHQQVVHSWKKRRVPAERAVQIERVTNGLVTRAELRPDLFGVSPPTPGAAVPPSP
jgi:DNA-binding transcriptional regulator YdaS (Cro superfamily)